jgi:tetratricopeptide (TPR) repeat protein
MTRGRLDESLREALRAQELDPLSPMVNIFCAVVYSAQKKYDLAEKQIKKTLEIDPNFLPAHSNLSGIYLRQGRFAEAEKEVRELMALANSDARSKPWLAAVYAFAGRKGDATKILEELGSKPHDDAEYVSAQGTVLTYLGLGEKEKAIGLIEKEYEMHASWLTDMPTDPLYASVISEPRVVAVMRKIGLAD